MSDFRCWLLGKRLERLQVFLFECREGNKGTQKQGLTEVPRKSIRWFSAPALDVGYTVPLLRETPLALVVWATPGQADRTEMESKN